MKSWKICICSGYLLNEDDKSRLNWDCAMFFVDVSGGRMEMSEANTVKGRDTDRDEERKRETKREGEKRERASDVGRKR